MKSQKELLQIPYLEPYQTGEDGGMGRIYLNGIRAKPAAIVWSIVGDWEHVSVSYPRRCPTWDEMCKVKDLFFDKDETVVQFHPKKGEYVNLHPYCLHLWRKQGSEFELPAQRLV